MTDQEINESVARKLGWEAVHGEKIEGLRDELIGIRGDPWIQTIPDYCHSIAAAWEIADKQEYVYLFKLGNGDWECKLNFADGPQTYTKATTMPMAICLAFLKLP